MKETLVPENVAATRERQWRGLLYGLFASLAYIAFTWGYDAYILYQSHASLPFLKLIVGGTFCLLIGGFIGWLTARLDNSLVGLVGWLVAAVLFSWMASHLPFEGTSLVAGWFDPHFQGLSTYPYTDNVHRRMIVIYSMALIAFGLAGGLQNALVESSQNAPSRIAAFLILIATLPLYAIAGSAADNVNQQIRQPIAAVGQLVQSSLQVSKLSGAQSLTTDRQFKAILPVSSLLDRPYRLVLGSYDPQYFDDFSVYIDFSGEWATCSVLIDNPTLCQPSPVIYGRKLACLVQTGDQQACYIQATQAGMDWAQGLRQPDQDDDPGLSVGVIDQLGNQALIVVQTAQDSRFQCRLEMSGQTRLEQCDPLQNAEFGSISLISVTPVASNAVQPTVIASEPQSTPQPPAGEILNDQNLAVLPAVQATLPDSLSLAPVYTITVNLDFGADTYSGEELLRYTNAEEVSLDRIYFHLLPNGGGSYGNGALQVTQTRVAGAPVETQASVSNSVLEVPLAQPLPPGGQTYITLSFTAQVPRDFGGEATPAAYGIFNDSDQVMALSGWYPILAVYDAQGWHLDPVSDIGDSTFSDMAYYSIDLTLAQNLKVAATGVTAGQTTSGDLTTLHLLSGPARDFLLMISPDFESVTRTLEGTTVTSYYLPGNQAGGQQALEVAAQSLNIYNQQFGAYPYTELDIVDAPMRNASGVEFPGIVMIGDSLYEQPTNPAFAVTVAHEVAHQWWYNVVGSDPFNEPWLDEALATYSSGLYYEFTNGKAAAQGLIAYWQDRYQQVKAAGKDDVVTHDLHYFENLNDVGVYSAVVYSKGALFYNALRPKIGDQAFFEALKTYYAEERFKIATAKDLLADFEKASGQQLGDFYQQWLYSTGQ